jgi:hypothetical protein
MKTYHILVPKDAPIHFFFIGADDVKAERERVEGIAFDLAGGALLIIPALDEPFVPAD